ncbi:MAG: RNA-binding protein [Deltaproteobacteria bacterium]|nr:RNA-binding protein [Deltaproteobacteria bacterium]
MPSINIYVGNLPYNTTESDLNELFTGYGDVSSVKIIMDRYSGKSKGFGFVEMPNRDEAEEAISSLDGREVGDRSIKVNEAKPRPDRRGGGGEHRRGGRY